MTVIRAKFECETWRVGIAKTSFKYYTILCTLYMATIQTSVAILFILSLGDRTFKWDNCQIVYNFQLRLTFGQLKKIRASAICMYGITAAFWLSKQIKSKCIFSGFCVSLSIAPAMCMCVYEVRFCLSRIWVWRKSLNRHDRAIFVKVIQTVHNVHKWCCCTEIWARWRWAFLTLR